MSYQDVCAANPAKTPCPFSCVCQGHTKVYPNQDCQCGPSKETPVEKDGTDVFQERFDKDAEDRVPAAHQTSEERYAEQAERKPVTLRDLLANPTKPVAATNDEMKDLVAKYFDTYPRLREWANKALGIELTEEQASRAAMFYGNEAAVRKTIESVRQSMDSHQPVLFLDLGQPPALPEMHTPEEWARRRDEANARLEGTDEEWEERKAALREDRASNLRATYDKARGRIQRSTREQSHEHKPVQHRDGKPPWCNACGHTADGRLQDDLPGVGAARPAEPNWDAAPWVEETSPYTRYSRPRDDRKWDPRGGFEQDQAQYPWEALTEDVKADLREQARARIDAAGNTYRVRGTSETRMKDVAEFARTLSQTKDDHMRRPWNTTALDLAIWQEHYDRAFRAYTDPFGTRSFA